MRLPCAMRGSPRAHGDVMHECACGLGFSADRVEHSPEGITAWWMIGFIRSVLAGKQLEHLPWKKVAELVRGDGSQASFEALSEGHEQLKTTVSDLLIWLNASNIEERLEY